MMPPRARGLPLARCTICGWHAAVAELVSNLVEAMFRDAWEDSHYLCTDATGVLVQASEQCRRGHFFVLAAPGKHVLFRYTPTHDGKAVDKLLGTYLRIPGHADHRFRRMPISDSDSSRSPIPEHADR